MLVLLLLLLVARLTLPMLMIRYIEPVVLLVAVTLIMVKVRLRLPLMLVKMHVSTIPMVLVVLRSAQAIENVGLLLVSIAVLVVPLVSLMVVPLPLMVLLSILATIVILVIVSSLIIWTGEVLILSLGDNVVICLIHESGWVVVPLLTRMLIFTCIEVMNSLISRRLLELSSVPLVIAGLLVGTMIVSSSAARPGPTHAELAMVPVLLVIGVVALRAALVALHLSTVIDVLDLADGDHLHLMEVALAKFALRKLALVWV